MEMHLINENIWFDSNKLFIVKGEKNKNVYEEWYDSFPEIKANSALSKEFFPQLIFISSQSCNLRCRYCYADAGTYGINKFDKSFFQVEDYISSYLFMLEKYGKISGINFFGGEPLLNYKEIKKFVEWLFSNYEQESIPPLSISTNGTIMTEEIKAFLTQYKIPIGTSLDGNRELNDEIRINKNGSGTFDIINKNMYSLTNDIKKGIQMTISRIHLENYTKGGIIPHLKAIENTGISNYEFVPVVSDDLKLKIDISNLEIKESFEQLCRDFLEYSLERLIDEEDKPLPNMIVSYMARIMKREYQTDCAAGHSFSISPDKKVYPCHAFAHMKDAGIEMDDNFKLNLDENHFFKQNRMLSREDISKCRSCIAKKICFYWCRGLVCSYKKTFLDTLEERCILVKIVVEGIVDFLANDYEPKKEIVDSKIRKHHGIGSGIHI